MKLAIEWAVMAAMVLFCIVAYVQSPAVQRKPAAKQIRAVTLTWAVEWHRNWWRLNPGALVVVIERKPLWGAAKIRFSNPSPIGEPREVIAIVPMVDIEDYTIPVPEAR
jgi:hypothetical protein